MKIENVIARIAGAILAVFIMYTAYSTVEYVIVSSIEKSGHTEVTPVFEFK